MRKRVVVHGRVQGVFFRAETKRRADRAGVAGWVRNAPAGTVEAVFEGEADAVERLVDFCRLGPPSAAVKRIEIEEEEAQRLLDFEVR